jgi:AraC-like DNA-binding protein
LCTGVSFTETDPARWYSIIKNLVCSVDFETSNSTRFFGHFSLQRIGDLDLFKVNSEHELARRNRAHIAADNNEHALLMFVESGELRVEQRGKELVVGPNMAVLYDLSLPYTFYHPGRTKLHAVKIPTRMLKSRLGRYAHFMGRSYYGETSPVSVTGRLLSTIADEVGNMPEGFAEEYASRAVDMIALMLESSEGRLPIPKSATLSSIFKRSTTAIDADLSCKTLDPAEVARRVGISKRYLHKVFKEAGTSVTEHLRERRLQQAYKDLLAPSKRTLTVGEIADRVGFSSLQNFSRSFRKRFGKSASKVRKEGAEKPVV